MRASQYGMQGIIITTDAFSTYRSLSKDMPNLQTKYSGKKGSYFEAIHRVIMGLKGWLRGIHRHAEHLQSYLDEYSYLYNRHRMKEGIFHNLLQRMMIHPPMTYKAIVS